MNQAYSLFNISDKIATLAETCEQEVENLYQEAEQIALYNQAKVLKAFQENKVSQAHLGQTTGYGYGDIGREAIEKIFASIFHTEDALVRIQFVSGTHTIATVLQAMLLPGDEMLAISGRPYDTLCDVIGLTEKPDPLSLKSYGVSYHQIDLIDKERFDIEKIVEYVKNHTVKMIHIQRSRGYEIRKALYISDIQEVIQAIRQVDPNVIIMVDNCYGEFTETKEPTEVGADIMCGSLIKNMGGGLAHMGGYVVGRSDLVALCANKLTCPGVGREGGATLGQNRNIMQGIFMAPSVVKNAIQAAVLSAAMLEKLGVAIYPAVWDKRSDIVQTIQFPNAEQQIRFVQGIQSASPIDSNVTPYPWDMPGYEDQVIMAAGTFVEGATIELSADGPVREPYTVYIQGGLTYESAKLAICKAIDNMISEE